MHDASTDTITRCTSCVLPVTTPGIEFDQNGQCNYCHTYAPYPLKGEAALLEALDRVKSPGNEYDCIIGVSGGRDSTYALLKMVKDYGMRVLAAHYQNPFTDPVAIENIEHLVDELHLDLVRFSLGPGVHEPILRHNVEAWFNRPSPGMVPMICVACKNFYIRLIGIARKHNVHTIVAGGNPLEHAPFKMVTLGITKKTSPEMEFIRSLEGIVGEVMRNPAYLHPPFFPYLIKGYLFGDPFCIGSRLLGRNMNLIDLFHYIPWDETELVSRIVNEAGWRYPERLDSPKRFDCRVGHLKDYMYMTTMGLTEKDDFYSQLVRQGALSRDDALERLAVENNLHMEEVYRVLDQAGLDGRAVLERFEARYLGPSEGRSASSSSIGS